MFFVFAGVVALSVAMGNAVSKRSCAPNSAACWLVVVFAGAAGAAQAASSTFTFNMSLQINAICNVASAPLDFGFVNNTFGPKNGSGTITVSCANGTAYSIGLGAGLYGGGTVTTRKMKRTVAADTINYGIFQNPARSQIWGNTVGVDTVGGTGNGAAQPYTVYGRVPSQPSAPIGGYDDLVQITVTY